MNELILAVIHDAKNSLGELVFRLEARGGLAAEIESLLHTSNRLTNVLLWHRQQEGTMSIRIDSASPADLLEEMTIEFGQLFPKLTIESDAGNAPAFWFYDETYIRLALVNALHNACHFAKEKVQLLAAELDGKLVLVVRDDGAGFSNDMLARHGQHQLADVSRRGTGLGLVLASAIANLHTSKGEHGQVVLGNDQGAVFELHLP